MDQRLGQNNKEYIAEPMIDWIVKDIPKPPRIKLFDDVSFVYEIQLARMELSSWWRDPEEFARRAAYYEEVDGRRTYHYYISDIRGKGQIGRSNQYLTHWYYPYKAKFHPQMIKALINWMGLKAGDVLLDPFVGSGTALIEAKLVGVDGVGIDIDPLCVLMSKVKAGLVDTNLDELMSIDLRRAFDFFHESKSASQQRITDFFQVIERGGKGPFEGLGEDVYEFYLLSYLYALSDWTYIHVDMWKQFCENVNRMMRNLKAFGDLKKKLIFGFGRVKTLHGDARHLGDCGIAANSMDGIVTSPPYSIAVDYIAQDLHAFKYLGIDPSELQEKLVGLKGKGDVRIQIYYKDMILAFEKMFYSLKPGRYCCVIIGDVTYNGEKLRLSDTYVGIAKKVGFEYLGIIRRPILGGFARLRYEYILIFKKS